MSDLPPEAPRATGIRFSPTIDLGHVVGALLIVGSLSGWALWGYAGIQKEISDQVTEMELMKQRQSADEIALTDVRDTMRSGFADIRGALERISGQVSDVRAQMPDARRR